VIRPRLLVPALLGPLLLAAVPEPPLRAGLPLPEVLDLRDAQAALLVPSDGRDPARVEAARRAWDPLLAGLRGATAVRLRLPATPDRIPLLLMASQVLKAQDPLRRLYVAFDSAAAPVMDETAWGAVEGGALVPEDLGLDPATWAPLLQRAQDQFPGRPWTLWTPLDPGPRAASLLGDGGRLAVPPGGPAARLAAALPPGFTEVEGGLADLTLRDRRTGEARRWTFLEGEWRGAELHRERNEVLVTGRESYDVGALLARMRATQLRDRAAIRTMEAAVTVGLHFQGERGSGDLGFRFRAFEKAGEGEELLRQEVLANGVRAKLHGEVQLPVVEARTSAAVPLALNLTERYRYLDGGPLGPGQRLVRFLPVDADPLLYEGEVTVVEATGRILEERSSRSGLPGMVRSERRVLTYGEPGADLWRVVRTRTTERWMGTGGVVQVLRDIEYRDFKVNDAAFEASREGARASDGAILKGTPEGLRYYVRQRDGSRRIEEQVRTSGRAVGGVILLDPNSSIPVLPLAGLLLYDFNAFGRGVQYSFLTAAVYNSLSLSVPQVGWGIDLSTEASLSLLAGTERPARQGQLLDREGVNRRSQHVELGLGRDVGLGFRLELSGNLTHDTFTDPKEEFRTPGFLNPPSGWTSLGQAQLSWQARGFQARATWGEGRRPEGLYGPPGAIQAIAEGGRFARWGGALSYDHDLGGGKWLHATLGQVTGRGFDRFQNIALNGLVSGIKPQAVAADRLSYALATLALPTGPRFRLNLGLQHGWARSLDDGRTYGFTGVRVAGDIPGFWWFTTVRVDLGAGIQSDIRGVRVVNGMISLLRLF
jgi:hypothetical protein